MAEGNHLTFIPKQAWLCLMEFVPRDLAARHRHDQHIWTTPVRWEGELHAEEVVFSGQETIIPLLQDYFARFDYSAYVLDAPPWALAAWRHLPLLGDPLVVAAFHRGNLVGLIPLAATPRPNGGRLVRWAGSPLTDKCDALVAPGQQDVAVEGLLGAVRSMLDVDDALHLGELDCDGLLAAALARLIFEAASALPWNGARGTPHP